MKTSLHVKTTFTTDAGLPDWWPLEILVDAARSAVMLTRKHGRHFSRPERMMPELQIRGIKDIERLSPYGVEFLRLLKCEVEYAEVGKVAAAESTTKLRNLRRFVVNAERKITCYGGEPLRRQWRKI
jgi:hypothetical protein